MDQKLDAKIKFSIGMDNLPMDNRDCWNNLKEKWNSLPVV